MLDIQTMYHTLRGSSGVAAIFTRHTQSQTTQSSSRPVRVRGGGAPAATPQLRELLQDSGFHVRRDDLIQSGVQSCRIVAGVDSFALVVRDGELSGNEPEQHCTLALQLAFLTSLSQQLLGVRHQTLLRTMILPMCRYCRHELYVMA